VDVEPADRRSVLAHVVWFFLSNKLITIGAVLGLILWGLMVAPFDWNIPGLLRDPVAVDAIPDLGENQQIVFTEWPGRSPQDVEDQVTYPLTVALLGIPGVDSIRSSSMLGFSMVYVIFEEDIDFYWSRSRILEKLNSLPAGTLPQEVSPALGPDATGLGQIFWYTLEGRDQHGEPAPGWDLNELRSIQDWYVRYGLVAAGGVSEVASVGGFVQEYQVDVDPDAMRAHEVDLTQIHDAIRQSNVDVGARTIEVNNVEYLVRGLGFLEGVDDIKRTVVDSRDNVPITIDEVGHVQRGPALRRGVLDKEGAEAVGGVVVSRYGANPMEVIQNVKAKIEQISPGLPAKAVIDYMQIDRGTVEQFATENNFNGYNGAQLDQEAWLEWMANTPVDNYPDWLTRSQVTIVPFYDRSTLIQETLGTLRDAITLQVLITIIVVVVMVFHLGSSGLISMTLPLAVLMTFIGMKLFSVDANIVALSGIAIAIGTIVDMGIIVTENILKHLEERTGETSKLKAVYQGAHEVAGAVLTAVSTTIISFLPVFTMTGAEGKLFTPLAYTKTFALIASVLVAILILPTLAYFFLRYKQRGTGPMRPMRSLSQFSLSQFRSWQRWSSMLRSSSRWVVNIAVIFFVGWFLTGRWLPLGPEPGMVVNFLFVASMAGGVLFAFYLFYKAYPRLLGWCLNHKGLYLAFPGVIVLIGLATYAGAPALLRWSPEFIAESRMAKELGKAFPGLGEEFMPALDEGAFLFMPSAMPHASVGESIDMLQFQDRAIAAIPEVDQVVGKIGRVDSALDPAPISMVETVVNYKSEYIVDADGRRMRFKYDSANEEYVRDEDGDLIPDGRGRPYRQWRDSIQSPDDIWDAIVDAAITPNVTTAPKLQPIETRLLMLQSGIRSPFAVQVQGPDLRTIEQVTLQIEELLRQVPQVKASSVIADRIVGKPYLEFDIDRDAIARYGLQIQDVQDIIEVAIGGRTITQTVEGRERYPVRVRYQRELRDDINTLGNILVPTADGAQIPLEQLSSIRYVRGPQAIKSEDTFLVGYVLFDKQPDVPELDVVNASRDFLQSKMDTGELALPAGVSYQFVGNYENIARAQRTLALVIPLALMIIFFILYLQFRSATTAGMVFTAVGVAWAGGFMMIWLYGEPWFLDFSVAGMNMRELFQVHPINLSVAIWVGFLALFGIATDDGVVIATYLDQSFGKNRPGSVQEIRAAVLEAGKRRIRPCLMTSATTILALLPVLTSTGRGSDVMIPMAIPIFGGMVVVLITLFLVPVLYCWREEARLRVTGTTIGEQKAEGAQAT